MPTPTEMADWIVAHLLVDPARVADVLAGPKREGWFNSEAFVALSRRTEPDAAFPGAPTFACYGEREYGTIMASLTAAAPTVYGRRRPDVVVFDGNAGPQGVIAIIETKLFVAGENPTAELQRLDQQLGAVRQVLPHAAAIGLVLVAEAPYRTPGTTSKVLGGVRQACDTLLPAPRYAWLPCHDLTATDLVHATSFQYPAMTVSLSAGFRQLL